MNALRREKIREFLRENGAATIRELSTEFPEVSLMTIHRDLDALEQEGCILKMRGGARYIAEAPKAEPAFPIRAVENLREKERIAAFAARFVREGMTIFIDAGTTGLALARQLPDLAMTVFTSAPNIALAVSEKNEPFVHLCGGMLNRRNMALSGSASLEYFDKVNIDVAFLVSSGYTPKAGFTCGKESEAQLKIRVISKAAAVVLLMDGSKFGKVLPFTFAGADDVDCFVTDGALEPELRAGLEEKDVRIFAGDDLTRP